MGSVPAQSIRNKELLIVQYPIAPQALRRSEVM